MEDVPGVTRDRVAYEAEWAGRDFTLVDTGGWEVDATGINLRVAEQAEIAVELADAVLFVVDATVGATDDDEAVVRLLRRVGQAGGARGQQGRRPALRGRRRRRCGTSVSASRGPVSALHGRGSGDVLDAVLDVLPEVSAVGGADAPGGPRRVALLGRPNVGKSSLLNKLAGEERVVVDASPGPPATRWTSSIELGGSAWRFVDTAGIRRRVHQARGADFYASLRTQAALEKAEVAVVLVDASEVAHRAGRAHHQQVVDAGRALVIAYNKWDLIDEERRYYLEREIERDLSRSPGRRGSTSRRGPAAHRQARARRSTRRWTRGRPGSPPAGSTPSSARSWRRHPHPVRGGKQPRILFATQAGTRPPRFVLFASGFLEAGLPALRRAPAARGVRLRGHPDRDLGAGAREAGRSAEPAPPRWIPRQRRWSIGTASGPRGIRFRPLRDGAATGCGAAW